MNAEDMLKNILGVKTCTKCESIKHIDKSQIGDICFLHPSDMKTIGIKIGDKKIIKSSYCHKCGRKLEYKY